MKIDIFKYSRSRFLLLFIVISSLTFSSCEKRWEEMNSDPNRLTDLPDEYLFTNAVRGAFHSGGGLVNIDYAGQYSHIFIGNAWRREIDKYNAFNLPDDISEIVFKDIYQGPIRNSIETLLLTEEGKYKNEMRHAQAQVIYVISFTKLTDMFGDVPYFEGGMGKYGIHKPNYDKQEDIYSDMVSTLASSIQTLNNGNQADAYPSGIDPIYDGDIDKWIRLANSVRLRLSLRALKADFEKYSIIIDECLSEKLIEENSQNATLTTWDSNDGSLYNPWYGNILDYQGGIYPLLWSDFFIELLEDSNDPRLSFFATKNRDGEYLGMPNGLVDQHASLPSFATWDKSNTSRPTEEFFAKDQPIYLFTASEIWLMKAELALADPGIGDPNILYQKGVELNMTQWNIDQTQISDYLENQADGQLSGSVDDKMELIATQLYISHIPNTLESWSTIRRTGYPVIPQRTAENLSKGITDGYMPLRIGYPSTVELTVNGENLQLAIDRMGEEERIDIPLWWDVN